MVQRNYGFEKRQKELAKKKKKEEKRKKKLEKKQAAETGEFVENDADTDSETEESAE